MQEPLQSREPRLEKKDSICQDLEIKTDYAIRLVCDSLILARHLQHAIDLRWRLITETRRMSNGMREIARRRSEDSVDLQQSR